MEDPICNGCGKTTDELPGNNCVETRYSLGLYAGIWCDKCWKKSGYRKEGSEGFNPMDAGESYEPI